MAAINDEVYARVREKIKEHNLTEQEVKVIDTARDKLQSHSNYFMSLRMSKKHN